MCLYLEVINRFSITILTLQKQIPSPYHSYYPYKEYYRHAVIILGSELPSIGKTKQLLLMLGGMKNIFDLIT
jgi:hypothetical protein